MLTLYVAEAAAGICMLLCGRFGIAFVIYGFAGKSHEAKDVKAFIFLGIVLMVIAYVSTFFIKQVKEDREYLRILTEKYYELLPPQADIHPELEGLLGERPKQEIKVTAPQTGARSEPELDTEKVEGSF